MGFDSKNPNVATPLPGFVFAHTIQGTGTLTLLDTKKWNNTSQFYSVTMVI